MYGPLRKKLLNNQYLSEKEKLLLLKSRVITSFMHGAGLHALRTQREQEKFADVVARFHRGAFRPIVGVSSRGYTNLEIASILGLALPEELLAVARARALADLGRAKLLPVLRCFEADGHWWRLACEAAKVVGILPSSMAAQGPLLPWRCTICHMGFQGKRQLSVHLSRHHGCRPTHVQSAFGTTCQQCLTEFWTLRRLTEHLRQAPRCS